MNDQNQIITKDILRETLQETMSSFQSSLFRSVNLSITKAIDDLTRIINKSFEGIELRMAKQEDLLALTSRVDRLEKRMDSFEKFQKFAEGRFDDIFRELKEIKSQIKIVDVRADVVSLEIRVEKIEREIRLKT